MLNCTIYFVFGIFTIPLKYLPNNFFFSSSGMNTFVRPLPCRRRHRRCHRNFVVSFYMICVSFQYRFIISLLSKLMSYNNPLWAVGCGGCGCGCGGSSSGRWHSLPQSQCRDCMKINKRQGIIAIENTSSLHKTQRELGNCEERYERKGDGNIMIYCQSFTCRYVSS